MMDVPHEPFRESPQYARLKSDIADVLTAFDSAAEWADLIKCLQRLNKVCEKVFSTDNFQALVRYPHLPEIPDKHTVARRLAQCLNPELPGGVHIKALETYEVIFARIGVRLLYLALLII